MIFVPRVCECMDISHDVLLIMFAISRLCPGRTRLSLRICRSALSKAIHRDSGHATNVCRRTLIISLRTEGLHTQTLNLLARPQISLRTPDRNRRGETRPLGFASQFTIVRVPLSPFRPASLCYLQLPSYIRLSLLLAPRWSQQSPRRVYISQVMCWTKSNLCLAKC